MSKNKNKSFKDTHLKTTTETMQPLKTTQEQQLEDIVYKSANKTRKIKGAQISCNQLEEEQEEILNVSVGELKDTSTDKMSAAINQLIAKNKISAKNAFDVPMIHLKQTKEYNSLTGDNNWKKISSTLDSNNKIYGYRVDATHNHTYKVLELLTRQEKQNKNIKEEIQREETNFLQFQNQEQAGDEVLSKYLQKNYKGINILHLEVFFSVNPILEKTKRIFDQQGLKGLLLNNIEIQNNLLLKLSFQPLKEQQQQNLQEVQNQEQEIAQNCFGDEMVVNESIFSNIYKICYLNDLLQTETVDGQFVKREDNEIDTMWRQLESLMQDKPQSQGFHQNLIELNSEMTHTHQQMQNHTENKQFEERVQKQSQNIQNNFNPLVETKQNNSPLVTQNPSAEQKELVSPNQCEQKVQISEASAAQSENIPQISELQLTKASDFTDHLLTVSKQVPISSVIRLSKRQNNCSIILKEIEAGEHEKDDKQVNLVETWKSGDKKAKAPKKQKKKMQKPKQQIDFFEELSCSGKKFRQKILRIQKVRKLEFKKFMKQLNTQNLFEQYLYIDTSKYKFDFKTTTLYREDQALQTEVEAILNEEPLQLPSQTNILSNQSIYIDLIDQNNTNQTKNVSLKYVKHKLQSFIFEQKVNKFSEVYYNFISLQGYVTPALCFLTILHLANEHGLRLQSQNDDIRILFGQILNIC